MAKIAQASPAEPPQTKATIMLPNIRLGGGPWPVHGFRPISGRKGMQAAAPTISLGAKISNLGGARSSTSIRRSRQPMA